jgi:hypothetical protein
MFVLQAMDKLEDSELIYALRWVWNMLVLKTSTSGMECTSLKNAVNRTAKNIFLRRFATENLVNPELTGSSVRHQAYLAV